MKDEARHPSSFILLAPPVRVALVSPPPGATLVDKFAWVADGFHAAGHDVIRCHSLEALAAADGLADIVVFDQKGAGLNHNSVADLSVARRSKWAVWWRDLIAWDNIPLAEQDDLRLFGRMLRGMDVVFVKERARLSDFHALGIHAVWLDQACPADMPACEHRERPEFDVLVLGRTDYPQRRRDVQALVAAGYRVVWAGLPDSAGAADGVTAHPWVHPTTELAALASRCAVALSVDITQDAPGYHSDRTFLLAGMGIPVIARVGDGYGAAAMSEVIEISPQADVAAWIYSDTAGLLACVERSHSYAERRRRGEVNRRRVMERHTYRQRAGELVSAISVMTAPAVLGRRHQRNGVPLPH